MVLIHRSRRCKKGGRLLGLKWVKGDVKGSKGVKSYKKRVPGGLGGRIVGNKWSRGTSRESKGSRGERVVSHGQDRTEDVRGVPWSRRERLGGQWGSRGTSWIKWEV